jgi:hypothetical protein
MTREAQPSESGHPHLAIPSASLEEMRHAFADALDLDAGEVSEIDLLPEEWPAFRLVPRGGRSLELEERGRRDAKPDSRRLPSAVEGTYPTSSRLPFDEHG